MSSDVESSPSKPGKRERLREHFLSSKDKSNSSSSILLERQPSGSNSRRNKLGMTQRVNVPARQRRTTSLEEVSLKAKKPASKQTSLLDIAVNKQRTNPNKKLSDSCELKLHAVMSELKTAQPSQSSPTLSHESSRSRTPSPSAQQNHRGRDVQRITHASPQKLAGDRSVKGIQFQAKKKEGKTTDESIDFLQDTVDMKVVDLPHSPEEGSASTQTDPSTDSEVETDDDEGLVWEGEVRELKSKRLRREQWRDRYATVENGQLRIFDKKGDEEPTKSIVLGESFYQTGISKTSRTPTATFTSTTSVWAKQLTVSVASDIERIRFLSVVKKGRCKYIKKDLSDSLGGDTPEIIAAALSRALSNPTSDRNPLNRQRKAIERITTLATQKDFRDALHREKIIPILLDRAQAIAAVTNMARAEEEDEEELSRIITALSSFFRDEDYRSLIAERSEVIALLVERVSDGSVSIHQHICPEDVSIERKLGWGASCDVHLGTYQDQTCAVKYFDPESLGFEWKTLYREIAFLTLLPNENIPNLYGACLLPPKPFVVLEYAEKGSVADLMGSEPLPIGEVLRICIDTARALQTLHTRNLMHRDIKPGNVLISKDGRIMLCDFGASRAVNVRDERKMTVGVGTPVYMPPEILRGDPYEKSADIYSFGMFMYSVFTGKEPFSDKSMLNLAPAVMQGERPEVVRDGPAHAIQRRFVHLIESCWDAKPSSRPNIQQVVNRLAMMARRFGEEDYDQMTQSMVGPSPEVVSGNPLGRSSVRIDKPIPPPRPPRQQQQSQPEPQPEQQQQQPPQESTPPRDSSPVST